MEENLKHASHLLARLIWVPGVVMVEDFETYHKHLEELHLVCI